MAVEGVARAWRRVRAGILVAPGLLLLWGCTPSSHATVASGMEVVVFVDFSGSTRGEERTLFQKDLQEQIIPSLAPGDRILIAPINDKTLADFRPLVEAALPRKPDFNGWFDNVLKFNRRTKDIDDQVLRLKEAVRGEVKEAFSRHESSALTDIFSSLLIARKVFHEESRHKVLVLMSDMIEDYPPYHFEQIAWSPATTRRLLSELDAKGLIPKLPDVCVYVSGVSAHSADLVQNIGRFWQAYFRRAEADMDASRYAHVLLHWPPSQACRV
jgi:hypothetical protein